MKYNYYQPGDWNATCSMCGRKRKASQLVKNWQGMYRCPEHNEPRQPQDFVRGVRENPSAPWVQPYIDASIEVCTINGMSAWPGRAMPGCMMPGNTTWSPEETPVETPPLCDIYEVQGVPGWAGPGCAIPSFDPFAA